MLCVLLINILLKENINVLVYANDLVLWTAGARNKAAQVLENKLNKSMAKLHSWYESNNITVNTNKTVDQTSSLSHKPLQLQILFNNITLSCSECTKYLGVTFDRKLTWRLHIDDIKEKTE